MLWKSSHIAQICRLAKPSYRRNLDFCPRHASCWASTRLPGMLQSDVIYEYDYKKATINYLSLTAIVLKFEEKRAGDVKMMMVCSEPQRTDVIDCDRRSPVKCMLAKNLTDRRSRFCDARRHAPVTLTRKYCKGGDASAFYCIVGRCKDNDLRHSELLRRRLYHLTDPIEIVNVLKFDVPLCHARMLVKTWLSIWSRIGHHTIWS